MKNKIFVFDIIEKESGKKCFSMLAAGKTEQGARAKLYKEIHEKLVYLAEKSGKPVPSRVYHYYKPKIVKIIEGNKNEK